MNKSKFTVIESREMGKGISCYKAMLVPYRSGLLSHVRLLFSILGMIVMVSPCYRSIWQDHKRMDQSGFCRR